MEKDNRNPLDLANSIALGKLENLKDLNSIQQRNSKLHIASPFSGGNCNLSDTKHYA